MLITTAQHPCTFEGKKRGWGWRGALLEVLLEFEVKSHNYNCQNTHLCLLSIYVFSAVFKRPLLLPVKLPGIISTHVQSPR